VSWHGFPLRLAAGLAVIAACGTAPGTIATDVEAYLARARRWASVEADTNSTIRRIFMTQFVDEGEVRRLIVDSRPHLETHLGEIRRYTPRSRPVEAIHRRYVEAWEGLLAGYDAILTGFDTGDYTRLADGRKAMEGWRAAIERVAADLRQLTEQYHVNPAGPTES